MAYIEITGLSHTYSTSKGLIEALRSINGHFRHKDTISVLGPSGCGKSTLLRCLAGVLVPTVGTIVIDGKSPAEARAEKLIGFAFQEPTLLKWRTVVENILLPAELGSSQLRFNISRTWIDDLLRLTGMAEFRHSYPLELSGGMQRRVALARALVLKPKLLLLDEPLTGLDLVTRTELMVEVGRILHDSSSTSIIVTHSVEEAVFLGSRVLILSPRPGQVLDLIENDEPQPRGEPYLEAESFHRIVSACRRLLFRGGPSVAAQ